MSEEYAKEIETTAKIITNDKKESQLVICKPHQKRKITQTIHEEDKYTRHIEEIIERDFFPHLKTFSAQAEYMDAVQRKDTDKICELQQRYTMSRPNTGVNTPSTFETPIFRERDPLKEGSVARNKDEFSHPTHNPEKKEPSDLRLDAYLARNTSEDNASFSEIIESTEKRRRMKLAWCYDKAAELAALMPPPSLVPLTTANAPKAILPAKQVQPESQPETTSDEVQVSNEAPLSDTEDDHSQSDTSLVVSESSSSTHQMLPYTGDLVAKGDDRKNVTTWPTYRVHNSVFFTPSGAPLLAEEVANLASSNREIQVENTRFKRPVIAAMEQKLKEKMAHVAAGANASSLNRVGPDGKELLPGGATPTVGGFRFMSASPSPAPGANGETPGMTWGEIEGTPFRLDGSDTPMSSGGSLLDGGPAFKMPAVPEREKLAHKLAEKATKHGRTRKEDALQKVTDSLISPNSKLAGLSPAAQRLFTSKLQKSTPVDRGLRASYSPSPNLRRRPHTGSSSTSSTSGLGQDDSRVVTPVGTPLTSSITDNLLNLTDSLATVRKRKLDTDM